jgi:5-formyltetrahydrofolate cyclo-ligase
LLVGSSQVVAAYAAVGFEPPTRPLLEALVGAGLRVLLPVVAGTQLLWGELSEWSALVPSTIGLLEPDNVSDAAAEAAARAELVLVPALAVDRAGHRLGRGGGYFDRWLPETATSRLVAVVYDDELVDQVPVEPHDRLVSAALTPTGVVPLGQ